MKSFFCGCSTALINDINHNNKQICNSRTFYWQSRPSVIPHGATLCGFSALESAATCDRDPRRFDFKLFFCRFASFEQFSQRKCVLRGYLKANWQEISLELFIYHLWLSIWCCLFQPWCELYSKSYPAYSSSPRNVTSCFFIAPKYLIATVWWVFW